jgi:predicted RNA-binding protein associated with RNAse of E/G family
MEAAGEDHVRTAASPGPAVFAAGTTAVRRDVLHGRVWTAMPHRVVRDTGRELVLAYWPGIESAAPTTWIDWLGSGDEATRKQSIGNLVSGRWELGRWVWRDTTVLSWFGADEDFSVHRFWDRAGQPLRWYVNFERPVQRTRIGIDTFDLVLDLVIAPDRSRWEWKDEDEYAQGRRLGLIGEAEHRRIERARERAVALVQAGRGPFAQEVGTRPPQVGGPVPVLPPEALAGSGPGRARGR